MNVCWSGRSKDTGVIARVVGSGFDPPPDISEFSDRWNPGGCGSMMPLPCRVGPADKLSRAALQK
jgi:hypothetical protein